MAFKELHKYANCAFHIVNSRHNFFVVRKAHKKYFPLTMRTAIFQNEEPDNTCHILISVEEESPRIRKLLSFERKITESVGFFLSRLDFKVQGLIEKKKSNLPVSQTKSHSSLYLDNEPLNEDTLLSDCIKNSKGKLTLRILDSDYKVVINGPSIVNLALPTSMRVGSPVCPKTFVARCTDQSKCLFDWYSCSSLSRGQWFKCGEGFFFTPTENELGCYLKVVCTPKNEFMEGPSLEVSSSCVVQEPVSSQVIDKRHKYTATKTGRDQIRVVSYNLLSDSYTATKEAKAYLFAYCDQKILGLDYRAPLLNTELRGYNADLYCLQEVDKKMFTHHLTPVLQSKGLHGVFYPKENNTEGCAMFYDKEKFSVLDFKQHIYCNALSSYPIFEDLKKNIERDQSLWEKICSLFTQIQIGVFNCQTTANDVIVVGNTHLYFHPEADHIRLLQGIIGFRLLLDAANSVQQNYPEKHVSIIMCGDFNSVPDCGIYKFVTEGSVDSSYKDWMGSEGPKIKDVSFSHSLDMKSAYKTPKYTNYTLGFKECIDYIFYQTDWLEVTQVVPIPSEEDLSSEVAIPSHSFPSDHIALVADLKWKSK